MKYLVLSLIILLEVKYCKAGIPSNYKKVSVDDLKTLQPSCKIRKNICKEMIVIKQYNIGAL